MLLRSPSSILLRGCRKLKARRQLQAVNTLVEHRRGLAEAATIEKPAQQAPEVSTSESLTRKLCEYCNATIIDEKRILPVFPTHLRASAFEELLSEIDAFVFDADGVLWLGNTVIPGSPEFLEFLIAQGKHVVVLTNNASRSRKYLAEKLKRLGFVSLQEDNVVNPAAILADLLKTKGFPTSKLAYLIGSPGLCEELEEAGIKCFGQGPDPMRGEEFDDDVFLDKDAFLYEDHMNDDVGAVIVGFEKYFNYVKMIKAANYLQNENCLFLGTNEDETSPGPYPRTVIPDTGPIIAAIRSASGREPIVVGKPNPPAFEFISKKWNVCPKRTLMVGDRINTDILFGRRNGLRTLLVLTGCHSIPELTYFRNNGHGNLLPEYYATSLGDLINFRSFNDIKIESQKS